jgi:hypothetical protein
MVLRQLLCRHHGSLARLQATAVTSEPFQTPHLAQSNKRITLRCQEAEQTYDLGDSNLHYKSHLVPFTYVYIWCIYSENVVGRKGVLECMKCLYIPIVRHDLV